MIHIHNLHKYFGDSHVLRGIDCDVKSQEVVCVIDPSLSGKSTFLRCMNALEAVSEGEVVVFQRFNLFPPYCRCWRISSWHL